MSPVLAFVVGLVVGCGVGTVLAALAVAAARRAPPPPSRSGPDEPPPPWTRGSW